ncbi:GNAT family N-acetyltransferase [Shimia sp. R9_3]|uniref:GNAT family N-acetyltransferase n=1 Tax=Shimia sp. R9_3 TaxID=2821113 RepID=UPI001ADBD781|nr:GNAT family N-acetyltransferase [Shimia sp. R9_3]
MTAALRRAQASDGPVMGAILQGWIEDTPWMPVLHSLADTQAFCAHLVEAEECWVAEADEQVQGFLARKNGWITALYLRPDARGRGLGTGLLTRAQEGAAELQPRCFQENLAAQRFYEAAGFRAEERTDGAGNAERLPDIRYVWRQERREMS